MNSRYKIKVVKECIIEADSDSEANQIADILADRESRSKAFGNTIFVYAEAQRV
jgi:hypothetical protein